jgi:UDP-N-acetylglucosamine 2-epimerase (non-hydrolysing)
MTILAGHPSNYLLPPLNYEIHHLLSHAWLVVSDSGEAGRSAADAGKASLILRQNTERPRSSRQGGTTGGGLC